MMKFGHPEALILEFVIWQEFLKTDTIYIAADGIPKRRLYMFYLIGTGRAEKVKKHRYLFIQAIQSPMACHLVK